MASIGDTLQHRYGPLPLWAYLGLAAVGIGAWAAIRRLAGAKQATATQTAQPLSSADTLAAMLQDIERTLMNMGQLNPPPAGVTPAPAPQPNPPVLPTVTTPPTQVTPVFPGLSAVLAAWDYVQQNARSLPGVAVAGQNDKTLNLSQSADVARAAGGSFPDWVNQTLQSALQDINNAPTYNYINEIAYGARQGLANTAGVSGAQNYTLSELQTAAKQYGPKYPTSVNLQYLGQLPAFQQPAANPVVGTFTGAVQ